MGNLLSCMKWKDIRSFVYDANVDIIDELIRSGKITDINVLGGRGYGATHSNNAQSAAGMTALHYSSMLGELPKMNYLLTCDPPAAIHCVTAVSKGGLTPLHYAAHSNKPEAIRLLLLHGANRDLGITGVYGKFAAGSTPLDFVTRNKEKKEANAAECLLLLAESDPTSPLEKEKDIINALSDECRRYSF